MPNLSELPKDAFARARAVAYLKEAPVDLTPRPIERRPTYQIGWGFWVVVGLTLWLGSVLFAGWTIRTWWGC